MSKIKTICVIDDDPIYVKGISKLFQLGGFCEEVLVFNNGQEAWDYYSKAVVEKTRLPDITLMDINMPVLDGWQLLDLLSLSHGSKGGCFFYVVSSSIDPADMSRAKEYPIVREYLPKPMTMDRIRELCDKVVKKETAKRG